jgi:hypothetical protein
MPDKGRRIASRQAQLGRRRRRQNRGPTGAAVAESDSNVSAGRTSEPAATGVQDPDNAAQTAAPAAPSRPIVTVAQPRSGRQRGERPTAYNYTWTELRRILVLGSILSIILVVVAFFI